MWTQFEVSTLSSDVDPTGTPLTSVPHCYICFAYRSSRNRTSTGRRHTSICQPRNDTYRVKSDSTTVSFHQPLVRWPHSSLLSQIELESNLSSSISALIIRLYQLSYLLLERRRLHSWRLTVQTNKFTKENYIRAKEVRLYLWLLRNIFKIKLTSYNSLVLTLNLLYDSGKNSQEHNQDKNQPMKR